jgi:hypothetical protein
VGCIGLRRDRRGRGAARLLLFRGTHITTTVTVTACSCSCLLFFLSVSLCLARRARCSCFSKKVSNIHQGEKSIITIDHTTPTQRSQFTTMGHPHDYTYNNHGFRDAVKVKMKSGGWGLDEGDAGERTGPAMIPTEIRWHTL